MLGESTYRIEAKDIRNVVGLNVQVNQRFGKASSVAIIVVPSPNFPFIGDLALLKFEKLDENPSNKIR